MRKIIVLLTCIILFFGCTKKNATIEIESSKCKNFEITHDEIQIIKDATCGSDATSQFVVYGSYDGDNDCFNSLIVEPKFYDASGNELTSTFADTKYDSTSTKWNRSSGNFNYTFDYSLSSSQMNDLSYVQLSYYAQDELETPSNKVGARVNFSCNPINAPSSFEETIYIPRNEVQYIDVVFSDHAAEDGDIISLNVNGNWVLENTMITNDGNTYSVPVNTGSNWFLLYAVNEGSSPPNTVTVEVNTGNTTYDQEFSFNMKTTETTAFKIIVTD